MTACPLAVAGAAILTALTLTAWAMASELAAWADETPFGW